MSRSRHVTSEEYFGRPDVVREYASFDFLLPPEQVILDELAPLLPRARMLDLGVGGGRTTLHFVDRVAEYAGVDSSPAMIEACASRFADRMRPGVSFLVADARELSEFDAESFDVVLFAFQGLDSLVDHGERLKALLEIHRLLAPDGIFVFSSDNLDYLRDKLSVRKALGDLVRPPGGRLDPLILLRKPRLTVRTLARPLRLRRHNPSRRSLHRHARYVYLRPPYELSQAGYANPAELIEIDGYAIEPGEQMAQLASAGFLDVRTFSPAGTEVTGEDGRILRQFHWLYYLCRKGRRPAASRP